VTVRTVSGHSLTVTRSHPVWTLGRGWVAAGDLSCYDELLTNSGGHDAETIATDGVRDLREAVRDATHAQGDVLAGMPDSAKARERAARVDALGEDKGTRADAQPEPDERSGDAGEGEHVPASD